MAEHLPGGREHVFWKLVLVLPDFGEEQSPASPGRSGSASLWGGVAEKAAWGGGVPSPESAGQWGSTRGSWGVRAACSSRVQWEHWRVVMRWC